MPRHGEWRSANVCDVCVWLSCAVVMRVLCVVVVVCGGDACGRVCVWWCSVMRVLCDGVCGSVWRWCAVCVVMCGV